MIKSSLVAAAVLALGAAGVSSDDAGAIGRPASGLKFTFVDLQPRGNHRLADALGDLAGNNLAAAPKGPQNLAGTWFHIGDRLIRVRGRRAPEPPEAVRGIAIDARFDVLHILHSTMFGNAFGADDGTEIGAYLVRYADGSEERVPIIYGADVRDWWRSSDSEQPTRAKLAWGAPNAATGPDDEIRLFASRWTNPRPEIKVLTIDFETKDTPCAPFLVSLTLERTLRRRTEPADAGARPDAGAATTLLRGKVAAARDVEVFAISGAPRVERMIAPARFRIERRETHRLADKRR